MQTTFVNQYSKSLTPYCFFLFLNFGFLTINFFNKSRSCGSLTSLFFNTFFTALFSQAYAVFSQPPALTLLTPASFSQAPAVLSQAPATSKLIDNQMNRKKVVSNQFCA